ncbi:hypothetical protein HK096_000780 [Nowakowskiella sp. JEL0078]|nr:hypothetical protein HK096_000780 [Nowakowskiella sp. JEL0078]
MKTPQKTYQVKLVKSHSHLLSSVYDFSENDSVENSPITTILNNTINTLHNEYVTDDFFPSDQADLFMGPSNHQRTISGAIVNDRNINAAWNIFSSCPNDNPQRTLWTNEKLGEPLKGLDLMTLLTLNYMQLRRTDELLGTVKLLLIHAHRVLLSTVISDYGDNAKLVKFVKKNIKDTGIKIVDDELKNVLSMQTIILENDRVDDIEIGILCKLLYGSPTSSPRCLVVKES